MIAVVYHLARYVDTASLPSDAALIAVTLYLSSIRSRQNTLRELGSNRAKFFFSTLIQNILELCGTIHDQTTAYDPQTDGIAERFISLLQVWFSCTLVLIK